MAGQETSGEQSPERRLQRWRLDISYDGRRFSGWASQPGRRTVQGEIERWIQQVLRLPDPVTLICAGRTDAGVHARGQVAHVDLPATLPLLGSGRDDPDPARLLRHRLARVLPEDIAVRSVTVAPAGFDARFSACWRRYVYRISDGDSPADPLLRNHTLQLRASLDLAAMNDAATGLLGLRDFAAFCRRREGATTVRTLLQLVGHRIAGGPAAGSIQFTVRADAFCHSMVRSLMGALVAVGTHRRDATWLGEIAGRPVRDTHVAVLPAHGLTLEEVGYPDDQRLAARAVESRSRRQPPP